MIADVMLSSGIAVLGAISPETLFKVVMSRPFYADMLWQWAQQQVTVTDARVVELGCGPGLLSMRLADTRGCEVLGIDRSPGMVDSAMHLARQRQSTAQFLCADALASGLADQSFDCVLGASILNVVDGPASIVREARRLSRGRVSFLVPTPNLTTAAATTYATKHGLDLTSRAVIMTWARLSKKMTMEQASSAFMEGGAQAPVYDTYLDGMVVSVSTVPRFATAALPPTSTSSA